MGCDCRRRGRRGAGDGDLHAQPRRPEASVLLLDGAKKPGAKILVSGGGRCNVTNTVVTERDYWGGPPAIVRRVLRALTVADTVRFFADAGVDAARRARRQALSRLEQRAPGTRRAARAGSGERRRAAVVASRPRRGERLPTGFASRRTRATCLARRVVLATGGLSLPKTGSDGAGYALARALGHTIVATTPALAPLVLSASGRGCAGDPSHLVRRLAAGDPDALGRWQRRHQAAGLDAVDAFRRQRSGGARPVAPLAARAARGDVPPKRRPISRRISASSRSKTSGSSRHAIVLGRCSARSSRTLIPAAVAEGVLAALGIDESTTLASLTRDERRRVSSRTDGMAHSDRRFARLQLRRSHGGRHRPAGDRSVDDGVEVLSGTLPGRRDAGRRRPPWRVQLSVGLVERGRGGAGVDPRVESEHRRTWPQIFSPFRSAATAPSESAVRSAGRATMPQSPRLRQSLWRDGTSGTNPATTGVPETRRRTRNSSSAG